MDGSVFPLLLSSLQPCLLNKKPLGRGICSSSLRTGTLFCCHPIAMTQFHRGTSQPLAFSFLSLLSPFPSLPFTAGI